MNRTSVFGIIEHTAINTTRTNTNTHIMTTTQQTSINRTTDDGLTNRPTTKRRHPLSSHTTRDKTSG